ncbi:tellurite resistance TerB family protein [Pseudomonas sp. 5P_3.1_Bac2]|uniref:tellurite resistance TerB family protein n=1 Tax=Pseudomonas sp. 5P_3.1_Bac2 TaxID=2971617 RepID=UPI0021CA27C0|nr:tellurite resistance TerB family protein [Pseudomonas sp. 5P_3.1_Bac2]MCU1719627.1 tellurite resistance TerB family protein [Pseudomonas sp. 5P_3.1_Bac2]
MNTRGLLDQLLKSGQELLQQKGAAGSKTSAGAGGGLGGLGDVLGGVLGNGKPGNLGGLLNSAGGKALAAGALGILLGTKGGRNVGGKALTYGGLAALGMAAYKAYSNWQAQQGAAASAPLPALENLSSAEAEAHSQAILKALVGAAKADGHIDERERELIEAELHKLTADVELRQWLQSELNKPLDPVEIAQAASSPEIAAQMYLASVLMVDEEHYMERAYLDELARQLQLAPGLKAELEAQVRQG